MKLTSGGTPVSGLAGCRVYRPPGLGRSVEVVEADGRPRYFRERVSLTLGICRKRGSPHHASADGHRLFIPEDTLIIRPPGCVWNSDVTDARFVSIDIDAAHLPELGSFQKMAALEPGALPAFAALVRALHATSALRQGEALAGLLEGINACGLARLERAEEGVARAACRRAVDYLHANLSVNVTLDTLAAAAGANKFVLLRRFKQQLGITPHAYLLQLRIARSRDLLAAGMGAGEVAVEVGFADQSHLGRHFKRSVGMTPARYTTYVRAVVSAP